MYSTDTNNNSRRTIPQSDTPAILAIERDTEVARLYHSWLSRQGYSVRTVPGKISASEALNDDVQLVVVGDFLGAEEWLNDFCHSRYAHIPVIVASSRNDILARTKGDNGLGAITKPFHMEELNELIKVLLTPNWKDNVSEDRQLH